MSDPYGWNGANPIALQDWRYYNMLVKACRLRAWAIGFGHGAGEFPDCTPPEMNGVSDGTTHAYTPSLILAISATTIQWDIGTLSDNIIHKINGEPTVPVDAILPSEWAVICWADNYDSPHRMIRGRLTHYDAGTGAHTVEWQNPWRLRYGPEGLDQFVGRKIVVIPSGTGWPWWHERIAARPSDFPKVSGTALARGPFTVSAVELDGEDYWFEATDSNFVVGNSVVCVGGPLDGSTHAVLEVRTGTTGLQIRIDSPGSWTEPYATGWTVQHANTIWPFLQSWGSTADVRNEDGTLTGDFDLVVGTGRWRITAINADFTRITCRMEAGETALPFHTAGYGAILPASGYWSERSKHDAFVWYSGVHHSDGTIVPNSGNPYRGVIGSGMFPTQEYVYGDGTEYEQHYPLKDIDLWIPWRPEDSMEDPQVCVNVNVTKSIRYLQTFVHDIAGQFVKRAVPGQTYQDKRAIPNLALRFYVDAGISGSEESLTTTFTQSGGNYTGAATAECDPPGWYASWMGPIYYVVVCDSWDDRKVASGLVAPSEDGKFHFSFTALIHYTDPKSGKIVFWQNSFTPTGTYKVYLTPGFHRQRPALLRYMYPKTCILPATGKNEANQDIVIDPVDEIDKTGAFVKRGKSTAYEQSTLDGANFTGGVPFVARQRARYIGDSRFDPPSMWTGNSVDKDYRAKWYTAKPAEWPYPHIETGTPLADIGPFWVKASSVDWFIEGTRFTHGASAFASGSSTTRFHAKNKAIVYGYEPGTTITFTIRSSSGGFGYGMTITQEVTGAVATVQGGFGSTLYAVVVLGVFEAETIPGDRTLTSGALWAEPSAINSTATTVPLSGSAFWALPDMLGNPRFVGFTAEIFLDGAWHPRVITAHDTLTQTVSWIEPLPRAVTEDDLIRILEPLYELNRWQERSVTIELPACDVQKLDSEGAPIPDTFVHFDAYTGTHKITYSGKLHLFLDVDTLPATQMAAGREYKRDLTGSRWTIHENLPGEVWERNEENTDWVRPNTSLPYQNLAPSMLTLYGIAEKWDYLMRLPQSSLLTDLHAALNLMTDTLVEGSFSAYTNADHDTLYTLESPQKVAGDPYVAGISNYPEHFGDGQWYANWLMTNPSWPLERNANPSPTPPDLMTSGGSDMILRNAMHIEVQEHLHLLEYPHTQYGVDWVQRTLTHDHTGGFPHVNAVGNVYRLGAEVDFYAYCSQYGMFHGDAVDPNTSQYVPYLAEELSYGLVSSGESSGWHVHCGTVVFPPSSWPTLDVSTEPTTYLTDPDPVPANYGPNLDAEASWVGHVWTIWHWDMDPYGPDSP